MITISTEQAKDLRMAFEAWQQAYDPAEDKDQYDFFGLGIAAIDELLALRKEREKAERPQSELSQRAQQILRDATSLAERLSAETDTTSQQFESLAFKSVVPEGWKLVPVELTKEMLKQIHPFAEATCLDCGNQVVAHCADNVTASWNDMLAVAPEPCK
ncbi:hypothetical protein ACM92W_002460 [Cronobacter turicensis]